MTKSARSMAAWIDANFIPTKYGTPRNAFVKANAPVLAFIKDNAESINSDGLGGLIEAVELGATVQVANGNRSVSVVPENGANDELSLKITYGGEMAIGDIVSVMILRRIESEAANGGTLHYALANTYKYVLIGDDLIDPGTVMIDKVRIPALATCKKLTGSMTGVTVAIAAVVSTDGEKCSSILYDAGTIVNGGEEERPGEL